MLIEVKRGIEICKETDDSRKMEPTVKFGGGYIISNCAIDVDRLSYRACICTSLEVSAQLSAYRSKCRCQLLLSAGQMNPRNVSDETSETVEVLIGIHTGL